MAALPTNVFDTIAGLPVHPLVVHLAVIVLPIAALALVALAFVPKWRAKYGPLTWLGLGLGTVAAFVSKESGEALARRIGEPKEHAELGDVLPLVAAGVFVLATLWLVVARRADRAAASTTAPRERSGLVLGLGIASALAGIGVTVLTVLVGHSGAEAAWAGQISATGTATPATTTTQPTTTQSTTTATTSSATTTAGAAATETSTTASSTTAPSATASTTAGYTMAQVKTHNSSSSCWVAIKGEVYDLTAWISQHPGGPQRIENLCGTDGTAAFTEQHNTQAEPNERLATFKLGPLAG